MQRAALDAIDEAILAALLADARQPTSAIAERVGLSPAATKRRIDRLERAGVITGYTAVVDHALLGAGIDAFIELRFRGTTTVEQIDETLAAVPEVVAAYTTAGDPDALLRVRVGDLAHLKGVIDRIRRAGNVTGTKTLIVLDRVGPRR